MLLVETEQMIQTQLILDQVDRLFINRQQSQRVQLQSSHLYNTTIQHDIHNQVVLSKHRNHRMKDVQSGNKSDLIVHINSSLNKYGIHSLFDKSTNLNNDDYQQNINDLNQKGEQEHIDWQKSNVQIFKNIQIRHKQELEKQEYNQNCQFFQLLRKSSIMDIQISNHNTQSGVVVNRIMEQIKRVDIQNAIKIEILKLNGKCQFRQEQKGSQQIEIMKQHNLSEITNEMNLNLIEHRFRNDSNLSPFVDRQFIDCIDQQEQVYRKQKINNVSQFPFFIATEQSLLNRISQKGLEQMDCQDQNDDVVIGRIRLEFDKKKYQQLNKLYHIYIEKGKQMLGLTIQNQNMYQHIFSIKSQYKMIKQEVLRIRIRDNQIRIQSLDECLVELHQNSRFLLEKEQLIMLNERIGFRVIEIINCNHSLNGYSIKNQNTKPMIKLVIIRRHPQSQIYEEIDKMEMIYDNHQEQIEQELKQMIQRIIKYDEQKQIWLIQQSESDGIINHTNNEFEKEWLEVGINTKSNLEQNQGVFVGLPKYQWIHLGHSTLICGEQQFKLGQLLI